MNKVIIEEDVLQHNIDVIKDKIKNSNTSPKIIAVVKNNAYGMGYGVLAQKLLENGIDFFAVSEINEGIELRNLGLSNDILILNSTSIYEDVRSAIKNDLILTIGSFDALETAEKIAKEENKEVRIHLKLDTGFSRFGFDADLICADNKSPIDLPSAIKDAFVSSPHLKLCGTYTHFQESYSRDSKTTRAQFSKFCKACECLSNNGLELGIKHCCNSSAFFKYPDMYLDAIRIGSAFTGRLQISENTGLKRVGYLQSSICDVKYLKKGSKIGYSGLYKLNKDTKVAVVECGYSDGFGVSGPRDSARLIDKLRKLKSILKDFFNDCNTYVMLNNHKVKVLGRIGMKNFVVDVNDIDCKVGDKVKIDINIVLCNQSIERVLM